MAKQRIVNTRFWDDSYIARLSPSEKLVFLYLLTSPLTTIAGVYELPLKRAVFDTGLAPEDISAVFSKLEADQKIVRHEDWIGIVNFIKHQSLNPKVRQGIIAELERVPRSIVDRLPVNLAGLRVGLDRLSHLNSNLNSNLNFNSNPNPNSNAASRADSSTGHPQAVQTCIDQLARKMRIRP